MKCTSASVVCLLIVLCNCVAKKAVDPRSVLPGEGIDRIRVTAKPGSTMHSTTHPELVSTLVQALVAASPDTNVYDTPKMTRIELLKGNELRHTLLAGGPLFDLGGVQYRDGTGALERVIATICSGIGSTATVPKTRFRMGEQIYVKWTVKNYSEKPAAIPGHIEGTIEWARSESNEGKRGRSWVGGSNMTVKVSAGEQERVDLKPDQSYEFPITVPTTALGRGKVLLSLSELIREQKGEFNRVVPPHDIVVVIE
jgi:hypothetical protein